MGCWKEAHSCRGRRRTQCLRSDQQLRAARRHRLAVGRRYRIIIPPPMAVQNSTAACATARCLPTTAWPPTKCLRNFISSHAATCSFISRRACRIGPSACSGIRWSAAVPRPGHRRRLDSRRMPHRSRISLRTSAFIARRQPTWTLEEMSNERGRQGKIPTGDGLEFMMARSGREALELLLIRLCLGVARRAAAGIGRLRAC
jgi:hypothetical protein